MTAASPNVAALLAQVVQLLATSPTATVPEPRTATPQDRVLLTVEDAAKRLHIGRTTAWGLVKSGDCPPSRSAGYGAFQHRQSTRMPPDCLPDTTATTTVGRLTCRARSRLATRTAGRASISGKTVAGTVE
ncbi:helix-turn-helix domain-containing protein [Actinophytocola sp.]|uniref:helix-turn-helix domain-containing protein n=1 Tax=Actinophytocola sp. TaxID=1872138 RepID=UPI0032C21D0C